MSGDYEGGSGEEHDGCLGVRHAKVIRHSFMMMILTNPLTTVVVDMGFAIFIFDRKRYGLLLR